MALPIKKRGEKMKKCLVAMSGGVDSSVVAYLLKKEDYEIAGATMKLLESEASNQAIIDAKKVCDSLGIKHYVFDLVKEFKNEVIDYFIETYKEGKTPNPCVVCNQHFKFGYFYHEAEKLGYSYIATGHYAKVEDGKLYQSKNIKKDQSYFLYGVDKNILKHVLFPLANYSSKEEVRKIAQSANLNTSNKKDSEDICFIENSDYKSYLKEHIKEIQPGDIISTDGTILGKHKGLEFYTIGQRKGLSIAHEHPLYVTQLDTKNNKLIVGKNEDLMHNTLIANNIHLLTEKLPEEVDAKVRSRATLEKAKLFIIDEDHIKVVFKEKQRAITKGQSIVFYSGTKCLGGGIIKDIVE